MRLELRVSEAVRTIKFFCFHNFYFSCGGVSLPTARPRHFRLRTEAMAGQAVRAAVPAQTRPPSTETELIGALPGLACHSVPKRREQKVYTPIRGFL